MHRGLDAAQGVATQRNLVRGEDQTETLLFSLALEFSEGELVLLRRVPGGRQFFVKMNGRPWPEDARPVSLSRIFVSLRKAVVGRVS